MKHKETELNHRFINQLRDTLYEQAPLYKRELEKKEVKKKKEKIEGRRKHRKKS